MQDEKLLIWRDLRLTWKDVLLRLVLGAGAFLFLVADTVYLKGQTGTQPLVPVIRDIPMFLFAGFYGAMCPMLSFLAAFVWSYVFVGHDISYILSAVMFTIFLSANAGMRGAYRSWGGTLLTAGIFSAGRPVVWKIAKDLLVLEIPFRLSAGEYFRDLLLTVPEAVLSCIFLKILFQGPDWLIGRCENGSYYTESYRNFIRNGGRPNRTSLGGKVGFLIMSEALILSIAAATGSGMLLSENGVEIAGKIEAGFTLRLIFMTLNTAFAIAAAVDAYSERYLTRPIEDMSSIAGRYIRSGQKTRKEYAEELADLKIHTGDEVEELYHNLGRMMVSIDDYIENIRHQQKARENLRISMEENKARTAFLSSVSRELRTPLNSILGLDEMILRESSEEPVTAYAADIRTAGRTLLSEINDVLDLSRIETGGMKLHPADYSPVKLVNELAGLISRRAAMKNLTFTAAVDPDTPSVLSGDSVRISQIILNLLTNAVKNTIRGGITLTLSCERAVPESTRTVDGNVVNMTVHVKDTGIGIREEDLDSLFRPYHRVNEDRDRSGAGTGLGLEVVRKFLKLFDAVPEVESRYGEGSDFHFTIRQRVIDWTPVGETVCRPDDREESRWQQMKVRIHDARALVIDDNEATAGIIRGLLKDTGLLVDAAMSGQEGVQTAGKTRYDIIFVDERMPGMDGIETAGQILSSPDSRNAAVPLVAMTANMMSDAREYFLAAGFSDFIVKPLDRERLLRILIRFLPGSKCETE